MKNIFEKPREQNIRSSCSENSTIPSPRHQSIIANPSPDNTGAVEIFGEPCYAEKSDLYPAGDTEMTNESSGFENAGEQTRTYSDARRVCGEFPPPITTIGSGGKPRVYFKPFRKDGRFVLREIRIPRQRLLQAKRENGRLKMRVLRQRDEEVEIKEEEEDD